MPGNGGRSAADMGGFDVTVVRLMMSCSFSWLSSKAWEEE